MLCSRRPTTLFLLAVLVGHHFLQWFDCSLWQHCGPLWRNYGSLWSSVAPGGSTFAPAGGGISVPCSGCTVAPCRGIFAPGVSVLLLCGRSLRSSCKQPHRCSVWWHPCLLCRQALWRCCFVQHWSSLGVITAPCVSTAARCVGIADPGTGDDCHRWMHHCWLQ